MSAPTGCPPIFESAEALQLRIDYYFSLFGKDISQDERKGQGIEIYENRPTITGLCLFLGFESRQSFYDYEKREGFSYTIKKARVKIENVYENMFGTKAGTVGSIFALKNLGWKDEQSLNLNDSRKATSELFPLDESQKEE